ncbi:MAG: hypothetical protein KOO63_08250 [Bacteroidales bacterium]|nr:hypothetical protein [Candidatus Latescibacterota bacterium]
MAGINALIAQGRHTNILGRIQETERIKNTRARNELLQLGIQDEPARQERLQQQEQRATTEFEQGQQDRVRSEIRSISTEFVNTYDQGGKDAALGYLSKIRSGSQEILQIRDEAVAAMQSPDPQDDINVLAQARGLMGQEPGAAPETFRTATPDELAGLGPDVTGAQVSETTGKLINVQKRGEDGNQGDQRDRKIADLVRLNPSVSLQKATKIIDGQAKIEVNEKTGNIVYTDLVNRTVEEIPFTTETPQTPTPVPGETLRELADTATGPVATIAERVEKVRAFFGGDAGEVTKARQRFKTEIQSMVRALSINPRFPVGEIDRIREEINIQPSMFQGEGVLVAKIDSIAASLRVRLAQADADAGNPNLDTVTRQKQGANASAIRNFLPILGGMTGGTELETRKQEIIDRLQQIRQAM